MEIWQVWCVVAFVLLILEMFTPTLFFLNLAIAALAVSVIAYFNVEFVLQAAIFLFVSVGLIVFLRPLLMKKLSSNGAQTGIKEKYINNIATVVKEVTKQDGRIAIYGEEWNAKTMGDEVIPIGSRVKIIDNESLIMFVERYEG